VLCSDNGPPFSSQQFKDFALNLGFHHRRVTPYWPRSNGEVERLMKTPTKTIKGAQASGRVWKQELYKLLRNYRVTPHCTIGQPPATLLFGRPMHIKLPELARQPANHSIVKGRDAQAKLTMKTYAETRPMSKHLIYRLAIQFSSNTIQLRRNLISHIWNLSLLLPRKVL